MQGWGILTAVTTNALGKNPITVPASVDRPDRPGPPSNGLTRWLLEH